MRRPVQQFEFACVITETGGGGGGGGGRRGGEGQEGNRKGIGEGKGPGHSRSKTLRNALSILSQFTLSFTFCTCRHIMYTKKKKTQKTVTHTHSVQLASLGIH